MAINFQVGFVLLKQQIVKTRQTAHRGNNVLSPGVMVNWCEVTRAISRQTGTQFPPKDFRSHRTED
jgi:hypothetical protein